MNLNGQVVIVTGGASGLGGATARMVAEAGGKVLIADVNQAAGDAMVAELGAAARFVRCDGTSEADGKTVGKDGPHPLAAFTRVINVNLVGSFNMLRLAAAAMCAGEPNADGERGVIINTASVAAFDGQIGQAAYSASKGGIVGMTLPIARDLARDGIRVCTIAPGLFLTPLLQGLPPAAQESLGKQVPFPPRLGRPSEYAQMVRQIFENVMLNGETIRLDGAIRMAPR